MNRKDLQELRIHYGYPAITIIMHCDIEQLAQTLIHTIDEAKISQNTELTRAQCHTIISTLQCPPGSNYKIALFVDKHQARAFIVPAEVPNIVDCTTMFKLDAVANALNRQRCYWVIDYTAEQPTLLEGMNDVIAPIYSAQLCELPMTNVTQNCFEQMANRYFEQDHLPICIIGPESKATEYKHLKTYTHNIVAHVRTNEEIWPAIQRWYAAEIERLLKKIAHGSDGHEYISGIDAVLLESRQGSIYTLFVEESYMRAGCEHLVTRAIRMGAACEEGYIAISVIDQLIETVHAKGGRIIMAPDGCLKAHERMVAFTTPQ